MKARAPGIAEWPLVGAATMRALDRHTIDVLGVPGEVLMESAGRAVVEVVLTELPPGGSALVVCGNGNNGGDGFVVARHLHALGVPVRVSLVGDAKRLRGDAARNFERLRALGLPVGTASLRAATADVIVDAIFGTGLARPVAGAAAAAIRRINAARSTARVVAVDLPSGLDADTGQPLGSAVAAHRTVTVSLPKLGLALEPGRSLAGRVSVARIGIADAAPDAVPEAVLWRAAGVGARLPARPPTGHKGSFGHVLVVAGSRGKTGAAALAAHAAARSGAGLVTVACPASSHDILEVKCTEMMTAPVDETDEGGLAAAAQPALAALARDRDVAAIGPGIGRHPETVALLRAWLPKLPRPVVLDADGLFSLGTDLVALKARKAATILTPHPGEAARLLGVTAADVNTDRIATARRLSEASGAVALLKGAATVVADPDGRLAVIPTGGSSLGSGGTGDVLTGVVAALVGQGAAGFEAAVLGAWLHGFAGDRVAARCGRSGVLASDLVAELPGAAEALRASAEDGAGGSGLAMDFP